MLRKVEKYEIEEEIGHGGMATVYRARDTVLERDVALKVMHPHLRGAEEARRRFHREAQSVARLRHPRVLEIYDFSGEGSSEAYIAAELLTGPTLKKWREDAGEIPAEIAACFVIEIAKALEAAHAAKIVHRDVKPENVLLHENRTLKLTDFGIADMIDAQSMTATGQILGSPGHMAPEQIEGRDTDARSDLFSLGTVLYYLATGRLPFTGRNPHQVLKRIMDAEYADPLRVSPAIGGRMRAIIVKALERDPADRYQSALELREALEAFVREVGIEEPAQTLAAYLGDPETVGQDLLRETVDRLIERGRRASDAGDVPGALDCYNRVLALDEGNQRVLALLERVGTDRRRRTAAVAGVGLIALGLVAGGVAWAVWSRPPALREGPSVAGDGLAGDGLGTPASDPDAGVEVVEAPADAGEPLAEVAPDAGAPLAQVALDAGSPDRLVVRPVATERAPPSRLVRLRPAVTDVLVRIDGRDEGRFQAEVTTVSLSVGPHEIVLVPREGLADEYRETASSVRIPAGEGEYILPLPVTPRDAKVSVLTNARDATVSVDGGRGRRVGTPDSVIFVPLRTSPQVVSITVSAPGYAPRTVQREMRGVPPEGGATTELRVDLEREGERAQAP
ncbi:MAG: serine/threonine protein kinase [Sandaracinaceae bacterium]|nr:serine/threonine protein kinase [Sandaracinaceae bacterium]